MNGSPDTVKVGFGADDWILLTLETLEMGLWK